MKQISELQYNIPTKPKAHSEHQECIQKVLLFMGEDDSQYPKWCGILKRHKLTPRQVHDIIKQCENWNPTPRKGSTIMDARKALFNKLIKNK
jgi:hypothetical protein